VLLLDTLVLVWLAEGSEELPADGKRALSEAASGDGLAVSAISFWEVAMLARRGRISLAVPISSWRAMVLAVPGLRELPVTGEVGIEAVGLPGELHSDPADRLLIATARLHGLRLVTRDRRVIDYGSAGHVGVLAV
jgi:PIN domain nuclease of toxin-antitoxin system